MTEEKKDIEKWEERHEVIKPLPPVSNSPAALMQTAKAVGMGIEEFKEMLELQVKWEDRESKKAFVAAMSAFKADPPVIRKDKVNKQFGSKYSSIDALVNPAIPYLGKYGLSHNWQYSKDGENPQVTCTITHKQGHSESVTMSAPPDVSGGNSKNSLQQIKSTQTYLKIATFEAVTGLVSQEANLDDDGNASGEAGVSNEDREVINNITDHKKLEAFWKANKGRNTKDFKEFNALVTTRKAEIEAAKAKDDSIREPGQEG